MVEIKLTEESREGLLSPTTKGIIRVGNILNCQPRQTELDQWKISFGAIFAEMDGGGGGGGGGGGVGNLLNNQM